jgi:hypothetical protein
MNDLKLQGEITAISEIQKGVSKKGNEWEKLGFTITTGGDYPNDVYFTVFGEEKVKNFMKFNKVGQNVEVSFNISSREFNERWYTDLGAWKVFTLNEVDETEAKEKFHTPEEVGKDDLPF